MLTNPKGHGIYATDKMRALEVFIEALHEETEFLHQCDVQYRTRPEEVPHLTDEEWDHRMLEIKKHWKFVKKELKKARQDFIDAH